MGQGYLFKAERIHAVLLESLDSTLSDEDLDERVSENVGWDEVHYGSTLVANPGQLDMTARAVAAELLSFQRAEVRKRASLMDRLAKHDGCEAILRTLAAERDAAIEAAHSARSYCFNDMTLGEFGDLYVPLDRLLDMLRPGQPLSRTTPRSALGEDPCDECGEPWVHEEGCSVGEFEEDVDRRARHEVRSHRHCVDIASELFAQLDAQLTHIEEVASAAHGHAQYTQGEGLTVDPHEVLELLAGVEPCAGVSVESSWALIYPELQTLDYCDPEGDQHSYPHRACRYLIS